LGRRDYTATGVATLQLDWLRLHSLGKVVDLGYLFRAGSKKSQTLTLILGCYRL
jgi:hypothetical protein